MAPDQTFADVDTLTTILRAELDLDPQQFMAYLDALSTDDLMLYLCHVQRRMQRALQGAAQPV